MLALPRFLVAALAVGALLTLLLPRPAAAFYAQNIWVSGTSTGGGSVTITVESFGSLAATESKAALPPTYVSMTSISTGSSPAATATAVRASLISVLPGAEYSVTFDRSDQLRITRNVGTFTVNISENIPGQDFLAAFAAPAAGRTGLLAAALLLAAAGVMAARRRRVA